jgi:putative NIF3 family GTP cyclohydrolase 1 type 2
MKQRRLKTLLKHDISLLAYHLPLDLHPEGQQRATGAATGHHRRRAAGPGQPKVVGLVGSLAEPMTPRFCPPGAGSLGREPLLVEGSEMIRRVGWCTGGGQGYIDRRLLAGSTCT